MQNPGVLNITTLSGEWCDKDIVMLHACFQLLTDCVEKENLFDIIDWEQDEKCSLAKKEITELYTWWKKRAKDENEGKIDPIWTENQHQTDTEMLIRLVKVRGYLWT